MKHEVKFPVNLKSRFGSALLVFAVVSCVAVAFVSSRIQLTGGLAEDHFSIGWELWNKNEPLPLHRPPGYPLFVTTVLALSESDVPSITPNVEAVRLAQSLLLAISCAILLWWQRIRFASTLSLQLALLLGLNPLMLILVGFLHYDVLHVFLTVLSCWVISAGMEASGRKGVAVTLLGGFLSGLNTAVRPMSAILPFFMLLAFLIRFRARPGLSLIRTGIFTLGLFMAIAPITVRNYMMTGKMILVNSQGGIALWASTINRREPITNHKSPWVSLWMEQGMPHFTSVTGSSTFDLNLYTDKIVELNDAFRVQALENIRREPLVYAGNVVRNAAFFMVGVPTGIITEFFACQPPLEGESTRQRIARKVVVVGQMLWFHLLTVLGLLGVGIAARRRDTTILVPTAVFACFLAAHALTWMDYRYLYIKVPFLLVFYSHLSDALRRVRFGIPIGGRTLLVADVVDYGIIALLPAVSSGALILT